MTSSMTSRAGKTSHDLADPLADAVASDHEPSPRRAEILRAAERLLEHYGFGKTTVADIAREAQVGVGTVYLEFPSKGAIVAELSVQRYRCVLDAMREASAGQSRGKRAGKNSGEEPDAVTRLQAMLDVRVKKLASFARKGQHGGDLIRCGACPGTEAAHQRFRDAEETLIAEFLERAVKDGELATSEPRAVARVLQRLYDSYSTALSRTDSSAAVRRELTVAHDLVIRGLLPRR